MNNDDLKLTYLRSFIDSGSPVIERIAASNDARNDVQPRVEPETGRFLEFMVRLTGAKRVLELGTSNGYSGLWMLKSLKETGGHLTTVDSKERLHLEADENFMSAGYGDIVTAVYGEAEEALEELEPGFDIIFQDCGKYLYPRLLKKTLMLLRPGGLLIADDTLFSVEPGVRPNLGRFTDMYNRMVFGSNELLTSIIPVGHGLTMSYKL